jgi:hypothetical protein
MIKMPGESSITPNGTIIAIELFPYNVYLLSVDRKIYSRVFHKRRDNERLAENINA